MPRIGTRFVYFFLFSGVPLACGDDVSSATADSGDTAGTDTDEATTDDPTTDDADTSASSHSADTTASESTSEDEGTTADDTPSDCGNAVREGDEECDEGDANADTAACKSDCTLASCGDGFVGPREACDDGPENAEDGACLPSCVSATCGDGVVQQRVEQCDEGPANGENAACLSDCSSATCGDGLLQTGVEECDEGMANGDEAACLSTCLDAACGDGFIHAGVEACDDGVANGEDAACLDTCTVAACGDGFVLDGSEECDDANNDDTDGCRTDCTLDPCGPEGLVLRVDADAVGANNGSSWEDAYTSVHLALQSAEAHDQVWVAEGRYTAIVANAPVAILRDCVDIVGGFEGTEGSIDERPAVPLLTVLDGDFSANDNVSGFADNAFQVVIADDVQNVLLDGLTISRGRALAGEPTSYGAGLYAIGSTLILRDVVISGNTAAVAGGGMFADDCGLQFERVTFTGNVARETGGGAHVAASTLTVIDSIFDSNSVADVDSVIGGGGLYIANSDFEIIDTDFRENTSADRAGGLYVGNFDDDTGAIQGGVFENNTATQRGGALLSVAPIEVTGTEFRENYAERGGAIYTDDTAINLHGVMFEANSADEGGALLASTNGFGTDPMLVENCTFIANTSTGYFNNGGGGAMHVTDRDITILDSTFTGNTAVGIGGAVYLYTTNFPASVAALTDSVFTENHSTQNAGGGIYIDSDIDGLGERLVFQGNTAGTGGGGFAGATSTFVLVDPEFYDNAAVQNGGGLGGGATIENGWFEGNTAERGGASSGASETRNTVFVENTATNAGGAISGGDAYIDCLFLDNSVIGATGSGGAVALGSPQHVYFDSCLFDGNSAPTNGGAIFTTGSRLVVRNSAFRSNSAGASGGAIHAERYWNHPVISSSTLYENAAPSTGGIVVADGVSGVGEIVNVVSWGNGTDLSGSGNVNVTNSCSQGFLSLGVGNVFGIADPIIVGPGGELFLDQSSLCVDAGDDDAADALYQELGLDWSTMTTDPDGALDVGQADMGVHYPPP
jgi:cysteine-rich repeat protein/predicted outer membrane repeat protein